MQYDDHLPMNDLLLAERGISCLVPLSDNASRSAQIDASQFFDVEPLRVASGNTGATRTKWQWNQGPSLNLVFLGGDNRSRSTGWPLSKYFRFPIFSDIDPIGMMAPANDDMFRLLRDAVGQGISLVGRPTWIFGYSYGGILAIGMARFLALSRRPTLHVFTFGAPKPGDGRVFQIMDGYDLVSIELETDSVCRLPATFNDVFQEAPQYVTTNSVFATRFRQYTRNVVISPSGTISSASIIPQLSVLKAQELRAFVLGGTTHFGLLAAHAPVAYRNALRANLRNRVVGPPSMDANGREFLPPTLPSMRRLPSQPADPPPLSIPGTEPPPFMFREAFLASQAGRASVQIPDPGFQVAPALPGGPVPSITAIRPATGPWGGLTTVIVDGMNLETVTGVYFGGIKAPQFRVQPSGDRLFVTAPANFPVTVPVILEYRGGFAPSAGGPVYTYTATGPSPFEV